MHEIRQLSVEELFTAMRPYEGFARSVLQCEQCGQRYGEQFLPSFNQGATFNGCAHVHAGVRGVEVERRTP